MGERHAVLITVVGEFAAQSPEGAGAEDERAAVIELEQAGDSAKVAAGADPDVSNATVRLRCWKLTWPSASPSRSCNALATRCSGASRTEHNRRVQVRRARPDEIEVVLAVLAGVQRGCGGGASSMARPFPTEWVMPAIDAGETWLAEIDGQIVGCLVVQWDDPLFWAGPSAPDKSASSPCVGTAAASEPLTSLGGRPHGAEGKHLRLVLEQAATARRSLHEDDTGISVRRRRGRRRVHPEPLRERVGVIR